MCWAASPSIILAVPHGPENSPPGCEQIAAAMSHGPHIHLIFTPICFARSEGCCFPTEVITSDAIAKISTIALAPMGRTLVMALSQPSGRFAVLLLYALLPSHRRANVYGQICRLQPCRMCFCRSRLTVAPAGHMKTSPLPLGTIYPA